MSNRTLAIVLHRVLWGSSLCQRGRFASRITWRNGALKESIVTRTFTYDTVMDEVFSAVVE